MSFEQMAKLEYTFLFGLTVALDAAGFHRRRCRAKWFRNWFDHIKQESSWRLIRMSLVGTNR